MLAIPTDGTQRKKILQDDRAVVMRHLVKHHGKKIAGYKVGTPVVFDNEKWVYFDADAVGYDVLFVLAKPDGSELARYVTIPQ